MFKSKFKVGNHVRGYFNFPAGDEGKYLEGIVKHIGIMGTNEGHEDSIWSDWNEDSDSLSYFREQSTKMELVKPKNEWVGKKRGVV